MLPPICPKHMTSVVQDEADQLHTDWEHAAHLGLQKEDAIPRTHVSLPGTHGDMFLDQQTKLTSVHKFREVYNTSIQASARISRSLAHSVFPRPPPNDVRCS